LTINLLYEEISYIENELLISLIMKTFITLVFGIFLFTNNFYSQVGIGNTNPKSILDIQVKDPATPTNTDGLLIPRVDTFPGVDPTVAQQGMLVFLTTTSEGKTPGFYYWDFPTLSWIGLNSSSASSNFEVVNIEDFLFDAYSGASGPNTGVKNDNQYAFTPVSTTGASSTIESVVTNNDYMGIHKLSTGSDTAGRAAVASSDWDDKVQLGAYELLFEMRARFSVASASAGSSNMILGLSNLAWNSNTVINSHTTVTAGVYFNFSSAGLVGACKSGGSISTTSALSVNANQWYKLKAIINATGTSVDFFVDGVQLGTSVTTNIPSSTSGMKLLSLLEKGSVATVYGADIDYITWRMFR
jgi:SO2946-like, C-terminal domain